MTTEQLTLTYPIEKLTWNWQGHQIQYTAMGSGQPLMLIHGFGASIGHWRKNIPVLAEKGYRVFALDLLGFGNSDKPILNYTIELWQQQIRDFWAEQIQKPTVFVGNSIGGLLTLMLMTDYPEMIAGGVLINCAGGLNHRPDELNFPLRFIMGTFTKLVSSPVSGKFIFNRIRQKNRIRNTLYQVYRDRKAVTDELVEMLYQPSCDPNAQEVFASVLTAPAGPKPTDLLPKIEHPLLVLWGDKDPWTPIKGSKIYQERAKQGLKTEFYPIPNAGHCPHDENPEMVNQLILEWLGKSMDNG
ncbi:alpha/beta hydrolase fold protein [Gloeothece citriformis PCC 7424]|uniref:Alpha/beta hydrolase fold protein n=1 Tax=Gloeothece citriformis (strain PCC 7424) TaxID=65393 RepID=B7K916_GLOC7|nr:alpha/beta fold hydrolase [Gloeothece citriformis]ACK72785.1 alpha/beta hydrolase fold protein [Gloeothece citriformis PCC 7424]